MRDKIYYGASSFYLRNEGPGKGDVMLLMSSRRAAPFQCFLLIMYAYTLPQMVIPSLSRLVVTLPPLDFYALPGAGVKRTQ